MASTQGACAVKAPCKINLFLLITGRRPGGYHTLSTFFLRLPEPFDRLSFSTPAGRDTGIRVFCGEPGVDAGNNTLTKAYRLYAEATGWAPPMDVVLEKGIPHGAGLGGGSSDAAEVLRRLQETAPAPLGKDGLNALAARIGADVPFFLGGEACLAGGIGDELVPFPPETEGMYCVLACPGVGVPTPWAYAAWDAEKVPFSLTAEEKADKNNRSSYRWLYGRNDFEPVVFAAHPELASVKALLIRHGAVYAGMSGSGSSLFGLYAARSEAEQAAEQIRELASPVRVYGPLEL